MAIQNTTLLAVPTTIFTCPGTLNTDEQEHAVTCMIFCNTSGTDATLNLFAVPEGSAYTACQIVKDLIVPAGETVTMDTEKIILATEDTVRAIATPAESVIATVSTVRVS